MIIRKIGLGILACLLAWQVAAVPHVILVMADDMGYAQTSYYNHPVLNPCLTHCSEKRAILPIF